MEPDRGRGKQRSSSVEVESSLKIRLYLLWLSRAATDTAEAAVAHIAKGNLSLNSV